MERNPAAKMKPLRLTMHLWVWLRHCLTPNRDCNRTWLYEDPERVPLARHSPLAWRRRRANFEPNRYSDKITQVRRDSVSEAKMRNIGYHPKAKTRCGRDTT